MGNEIRPEHWNMNGVKEERRGKLELAYLLRTPVLLGRLRVERGSATQFGHEVFLLHVLLSVGLDRCCILGG
jgi:hypothetical protein